MDYNPQKEGMEYQQVVIFYQAYKYYYKATNHIRMPYKTSEAIRILSEAKYMSALKNLNLDGQPFPEIILLKFIKSPIMINIEKLSVAKNEDITDSFCTAIYEFYQAEQYKSLKYLNLMKTNITERGVVQLQDLFKLVYSIDNLSSMVKIIYYFYNQFQLKSKQEQELNVLYVINVQCNKIQKEIITEIKKQLQIHIIVLFVEPDKLQQLSIQQKHVMDVAKDFKRKHVIYVKTDRKALFIQMQSMCNWQQQIQMFQF